MTPEQCAQRIVDALASDRRIVEAIRAAIAEERERCAVIAENKTSDLVGVANETGSVIAAAIRRRT